MSFVQSQTVGFVGTSYLRGICNTKEGFRWHKTWAPLDTDAFKFQLCVPRIQQPSLGFLRFHIRTAKPVNLSIRIVCSLTNQVGDSARCNIKYHYRRWNASAQARVQCLFTNNYISCRRCIIYLDDRVRLVSQFDTLLTDLTDSVSHSCMRCLKPGCLHIIGSEQALCGVTSVKIYRTNWIRLRKIT